MLIHGHSGGWRWPLVLVLAVGLALACGHGDQSAHPVAGQGPSDPPPPPPGPPSYDIDALGVPRFVSTVYIDLGQKKADGTPLITLVSMFRSSYGHDYSDYYECCRSMKHYFIGADASTKIYAPVSGTVVYRDVPIGADIYIQSDAQPAFVFTIMHAVLDRVYKVGDHLTEGAWIGHHVAEFTASDIIVSVNDGKVPYNAAKPCGVGPTGRLVSYFETLTDDAFKVFRDRGVAGPSSFILTRSQRDAAPLACLGEGFDHSRPDPLPQYLRF